MHQRSLRTVLLIQAIEETDRAGEVIPLADRAEASRSALRESGPLQPAETGQSVSPQSQAFLMRRAERLLERLQARSPVVAHVLALAGGITWLGRLLVVLAFMAGLSLATLDGSRRINILAFPLIGLIAWNLCVYALLLVAWLGSRRRGRSTGFWSAAVFERWMAGRMESLLKHATRFNVPLTAGLRRFTAEWSACSRTLLLLRAKRLLHVAAAVLAFGLIVGLYIRGIGLRYEAGWESTFLDPGTAFSWVRGVYGPASWLSGIPIGSVDEIRALRWTAAGGGGEAASWIHLIALTGALYIIVPRLIAAAAATLGIWRYSLRPPIPASLLGYSRALVMGAGSGSLQEVVSVIPYAHEPSAAAMAGLESLLTTAVGSNLSVQLRQPIRYGEEESVGGQLAEWNVLLMTLAATPETENQGAVMSALRDALVGRASAAPLLIVVDESAYGARMSGDAALEQRLQERRTLWREFVAGYGLRACIVNLMQVGPGTAAQTQARDEARAALWTAGERA